MDTLIATWFVADTTEAQTDFPQVAGASATSKFQAVYWRCIATFFATSIRVNPGCRHALFTNAKVPVVNRVDLSRFFADINVEIIELPILHRLPQGTVSSFGNQYYILDILNHVAGSGWGSRLIVLDSDCVWTRSVEPMGRAIDEYGALTYRMDYPADYRVNGVSRVELGLIYDKINGTSTAGAPAYFGGEIFAATARDIQRISDQAEDYWQRNLDFERTGELSFNEEAHLLSLAYLRLGIESGTANPFIKRMWTTFKFNNVARSDEGLTIWHLPAEKTSGFYELFPAVVDRQSEFWNPAGAEGLTSYLGRHFGVPRRSWGKLRRDLTRKVSEKLSSGK